MAFTPSKCISAVNRRFSLSSGLTVANRLFAVFIMGLMFIVVARTLGPAGQGVVATLVAIIVMAIQFGNFGIYASNIRFVGADRSLYAKAAGNSLTIGVVSGVFIAFALVSFYLLAPSFFPDITFFLLAVYALSLPFSLLTILFQGMLLAVEEIVWYNILIFARAVFLVGGVVVLLLFLGGGVTELIIFLVVVEVVFALLHIYVVYRREKFKPLFDIGFLKTMVGYGFRVYLATQLTLLVLKFDVVQVNFYLGAASAGVYSVASKMADMVKMIPETIALIFFPRATALGEKAKPFANKVLLMISLVMVVVLVGLYFTAGPATMILFGSKYEGSVMPLIILLPGIYLVSLETILMNYFASKHMPWYVVMVPFIGFVFNIITNAMLIPVYGINAAAFTSTISFLIMFVLLYAKYRESD